MEQNDLLLLGSNNAAVHTTVCIPKPFTVTATTGNENLLPPAGPQKQQWALVNWLPFPFVSLPSSLAVFSCLGLVIKASCSKLECFILHPDTWHWPCFWHFIATWFLEPRQLKHNFSLFTTSRRLTVLICLNCGQDTNRWLPEQW